MFVVFNSQTGEYATFKHGRASTEYPDAQQFETWGAASDWSQEYGPDFVVTPIEELP